MLYTKWNDPRNFGRMTEELIASAVPTSAAFAVRENEQILHTPVPGIMITKDELYAYLDTVDYAITAVVGAYKYLNSLQIYEYITLLGQDIHRETLRNHLQKLTKYHVIRENDILSEGAVFGLKYYEIDHFGHQLAKEEGVLFHKGNLYVSGSRHREHAIPADTACGVKRVLAGNQIVLNLLMSHAKMQRFGIMETMRPSCIDEEKCSCMLRTAAYVRIDDASVLAYEVVRDTPESLENLKDKIARYYELIHSEAYLEANHHEDTAYPQMILCGESYEHNVRIADCLRAEGLWSAEDPLLFTEDLLNMTRSLVTIYALEEDNSRSWYALPENTPPSTEAA